ncbi:TPA: BrnA antitoxin family protein [Mannheimia haemolytica]
MWDGVDEEDRPVTQAEFETAIKKRGRPVGSQKELVSLRLDRTVLEAFRASGKGWQSRINQVLSDFVKQTSP